MDDGCELFVLIYVFSERLFSITLAPVLTLHVLCINLYILQVSDGQQCSFLVRFFFIVLLVQKAAFMFVFCKRF